MDRLEVQIRPPPSELGVHKEMCMVIKSINLIIVRYLDQENFADYKLQAFLNIYTT